MNVKLNSVAFVSLLYSSAPNPKMFVSLDPLNHKKNSHEKNTKTPRNMFLISYSFRSPFQVSGKRIVKTKSRDIRSVKKSIKVIFLLKFVFHSKEFPKPRLLLNVGNPSLKDSFYSINRVSKPKSSK